MITLQLRRESYTPVRNGFNKYLPEALDFFDERHFLTIIEILVTRTYTSSSTKPLASIL